MLAKIYRPARNAMQSGTAKSQDWVLEFVSESARTVDPLMGWIGNGDTNTQVRLTFATREEAIDYARRQGIAFQVNEPREARRVIKSYAENFAAVRKRPWTH